MYFLVKKLFSYYVLNLRVQTRDLSKCINLQLKLGFIGRADMSKHVAC